MVENHDSISCKANGTLLDSLTPGQVEQLEVVFRVRFGFHTNIVTFNALSKPQHQMDRSLITFIEENDGPSNLLIVYYTGHGTYYQCEKQLRLTSDTRLWERAKPFVNWHRSEDILRSDEVDADVLTILDTAYASNQLIDRISDNNTSESKNHTKRFEIMSVCMVDETTAAPGPNSFTHALTNALEKFADLDSDNPFSVFSLNQRICMDARRRDTPSMIWSLLPNKSHIYLAPMGKATDEYWQGGQKDRCYLKLELEFRDEVLSQTQIEEFVRTVKDLGRNKDVGLRSIRWLEVGAKPIASALFVRAVVVIVLARRWGLSWSQKASTERTDGV